MNTSQTIITSRRGKVGTLTLNRPEVHNALHIGMIREFSKQFDQLENDPGITIILINHKGRNFSAGADLQWMKDGLSQSAPQLEQESRELGELFHRIYHSRKVTITAIRGKVIGGANGIVGAGDITLAAEDSSFAFTEVKLGLIPATIAPFVIRKAGATRAREWMLTGRAIPADEAFRAGLVQEITPVDELESRIDALINTLLKNAPGSLTGIKELVWYLEHENDPKTILHHTSALIAQFRTGQEGQEGMNAFFEKRTPTWRDENT